MDFFCRFNIFKKKLFFLDLKLKTGCEEATLWTDNKQVWRSWCHGAWEYLPCDLWSHLVDAFER